MNKKYISIGVVSIAILVLFGSLHTGNTSNEIIIGAMGPLSGEYSFAGENHKKGILLAEEEYNKKHPNARVKVIVEDDGFDVKKGLSAFKKLTTLDKVDALIMVSTPVIDSIYPEVNKLDMPVTNFGVQTIGISPDNIYQMSPSGENLIAQYTEYLNTVPNKKMAVLYDNTSAGVVFLDSFKSIYTSGEYDSFKISGKGDLKGYANKIAKGDYDSVLFLTSPDNGALTVKELLVLTDRPIKYFFDAQLQTGLGDYKRILGDIKKLDGATTFWLKPGNTEAFISAYKAKYGEEPGPIVDFGYDAFNTLMSAYDKDSKVWKDNIQNMDTIGVSGALTFDVNGVRKQSVIINKMENGEIKPIE